VKREQTVRGTVWGFEAVQRYFWRRRAEQNYPERVLNM
jgi:hypothetical protein